MTQEPKIPYRLATNPTKSEILAIIKLCQEHMADLRYAVTVAEDIEKYKILVSYLFPLIHSKINNGEFKGLVETEDKRLESIKSFDKKHG